MQKKQHSDILKKVLVKEQKNYEHIISVLDELYTECGSALLEEFLCHHTNNTVDEQLFATWKKTRQERDSIKEVVLHIKNALTRKEELHLFTAEVNKRIKEDSVRYEKAKNAFASRFFAEYHKSDFPCISTVKDQMQPLLDALQILKEKKTILEQDKNVAGKLKKWLLVIQIGTINSKQNKIQKKIRSTVGKQYAQELVYSAEAKNLYDKDMLDEPLAQLYEELQTLKKNQTEVTYRSTTLSEETTQIEAILDHYNALQNPQKHITHLTAKIKTLDETISMLEKNQGKIYTDAFYTTCGDPSAADSDTAYDSASSTHSGTVLPCNAIENHMAVYLTSISDYRKQAVQKKYTIEYITNELSIAKLQTQTEHLQKAINTNTRKIAECNHKIAKAEYAISVNHNTIAELTEKNAILSKKSTIDTPTI